MMNSKLTKYSTRVIVAVIVISAVILFWYLLTIDQTSKERLLYPSPNMVIEAFVRQWDQIILYSFTTLYRVLVGLLVGGVLGIIFGASMTWSKRIYLIFDPIIEIIRPIPPIALTPFFILWFGLGDFGQILLIALGSFMIITVSTFESIRNIPPVFARAARSLGANELQLYYTIYLPAILPSLFAGLRVGLATAFALTVAAEYLGAQGGLGYLMRNARVVLQTEVILLAAILLGLLSLLMDRILRLLFGYLTRWTSKPIL
ncbi:MAG: ABC transporter permease subunit [Bacteroidota bacterium]